MNSNVYEEILGMSHTYFSGREIALETLWDFVKRMKLAYADKELDEQYLFNKLEAIHSVTIRGSVQSIDDVTGHEDWFNPSANVPLHRELSWHFWDHYKNYLLARKRWPPRVVGGLDSLSGQVLSRIEDPLREGKWDRRGMVMGSVQSGKTANYTALITKAVDAGYKLIIILAGVHNSLRSQTQYRLNEEFLGYDLEKIQQLTGQEKRIGVRLMFNDHRVVATLTSSSEKGDFKKAIAMQAGIIPSLTGDPIILVIKKNVSIMKNLIEWATSVIGEPDEVGNRVVREIPLLVIDDECDYASVNTKRPEFDEEGRINHEWDPTKTNQRIRSLLRSFEKSAYVGYTATPYANIFIHKDHEHQKYGEDLFPRSFIISLPQPSNYIGPERVFGFEELPESEMEDVEPLPLVRIVSDHEDKIPSTHKIDLFVDALPESLLEALRSFILVCAARTLRQEGIPHNSMLVHVTRFTAVQHQIYEMISDHLRSFVARIMSGSDPLEDFRFIWEDDFVPTSNRMRDLGFTEAVTHSWDDIKANLYEAAKAIKVKQINGTVQDTLDYRDAEYATRNLIERGKVVPWSKRGVSVIAVGGDKLSRGLTLDGLTISYYLRASRMYDTLMQMGRWFGYREGYNDFCRIFTTEELSDWYRHIAGATAELRDEIDYMAALNRTPEEFGLKVRSHPGRLVVTSAGKSRNKERLSLSYSGRISETVVFDPRQSEHNRIILSDLIRNIGRDCDYPVDATKPRYRWSGVPQDSILFFLRNYRTQEDAKRVVDPERMADYIERQNAHGELTEWDVIIVSNAEAWHTVTIGDHQIGCVTRRPLTPMHDTKISIRRLLSPHDEFLDLSSEELEAAREFDRNKRDRDVPPKGAPSGIAVRHIRPKSRGLLLIYLPEHHKNGLEYGLSGEEVVGFGLSFPKSENAQPVEYWVNPVYMEDY